MTDMTSTLILLAVSFGVPGILMAVIGIYVYRDAKRRGMNAVLWTLVAILAPTFIGFIIYLLVRGSYADLKCPRCAAHVTEQYVVCPKCGAKLQPSCPNCSSPIELDWKVCPRCARPLPEDLQRDVCAPVRPKDKGLWKVLVVIIAVPLIWVILATSSMFTLSSSGASSITSLPVDEYLAEMQNEEIEAWFKTVGGDYDKAYVLEHRTAVGDDVRTRFLIYMPKVVENHPKSFGTSSGLLGKTLKIDFHEAHRSGGNTFMLATYVGAGSAKLKIYYDGKRVETETRIVDFPIGLTDGSTYASQESWISGTTDGNITLSSDVQQVSP